MMEQATTDAVTAARDLAPELSARAAEAEQLQTLPRDLVERARSAGLFRLATPRALGGQELPPAEKPQGKSAVRVLTRIGIPIFVAPVKPSVDRKLSEIALAQGKARIDVQNVGNEHFRIDAVKLDAMQGQDKLFEKQVR